MSNVLLATEQNKPWQQTPSLSAGFASQTDEPEVFKMSPNAQLFETACLRISMISI
jgi:hypothetical protein